MKLHVFCGFLASDFHEFIDKDENRTFFKVRGDTDVIRIVLNNWVFPAS